MGRRLGLAVLLGATLALTPPAHAQSGDGDTAAAGEDGIGPVPEAEPPPPPTGVMAEIDRAFGAYVVRPIAWVLFFDLLLYDNTDPEAEAWPAALRWVYLGAAADEKGTSLPFIVLWLVLGAVFFTLRMRIVSVWGLKHAVQITLGRYDDANEPGEVSHFQALSSALSATVGLGNIAGVAIAVSLGGPGAVLWMIVAGFFGMSSKFTECTLGQMYRTIDADGHVLGGPMRYLAVGLASAGRPRLGRVLAVGFAIMCIGGSFGGGNMFQANQAYAQTARVLPALDGQPLVFGLVLATLVGLVIVGGIKRIGAVAGTIVPVMCGVYVLTGLVILLMHASAVPAAFGAILDGAFTPAAGLGGAIGVMVTGFQRAAFSNEAGIGSASIAHSAAATTEPIREGLVALLEPLIDTIIICTMTGLVVVVTGEYLQTHEGADDTARGVLMTSAAFESVFPWFSSVLAVAVFLFAFSTMISWSYYGERSCVSLFGPRSSIVYRWVFLGFAVLGPILELSNVVGFSDLMILGMAFPNILGLFLLSGRVREALDGYFRRIREDARVSVPEDRP